MTVRWHLFNTEASEVLMKCRNREDSYTTMASQSELTSMVSDELDGDLFGDLFVQPSELESGFPLDVQTSEQDSPKPNPLGADESEILITETPYQFRSRQPCWIDIPKPKTQIRSTFLEVLVSSGAGSADGDAPPKP
jgi:hypothetical protein